MQPSRVRSAWRPQLLCRCGAMGSQPSPSGSSPGPPCLRFQCPRVLYLMPALRGFAGSAGKIAYRGRAQRWTRHAGEAPGRTGCRRSLRRRTACGGFRIPGRGGPASTGREVARRTTSRGRRGYAGNRIACSERMAAALLKARDLAAEKGLKLLVWDAARPQRAVDRFVDWSGEPEDGRTRAAHYPNLKKSQLFREGYIAKLSGHTRGAAVDLTLMDEAGTPLALGGPLTDGRQIPPRRGGAAKLQTKKPEYTAKADGGGRSDLLRHAVVAFFARGRAFPGGSFDFALGGEPVRYPMPTPPGRSDGGRNSSGQWHMPRPPIFATPLTRAKPRCCFQSFPPPSRRDSGSVPSALMVVENSLVRAPPGNPRISWLTQTSPMLAQPLAAFQRPAVRCGHARQQPQADALPDRADGGGHVGIAAGARTSFAPPSPPRPVSAGGKCGRARPEALNSRQRVARTRPPARPGCARPAAAAPSEIRPQDARPAQV